MKKINVIEVKDVNGKLQGSYPFSELFEMDDSVFTEAGYIFKYVEGVKGMQVMEFNQPNDKTYDLMSIIRLVYISKDLREGKEIKFDNE